jgi:hypothetical protein
MFAYGLIAACSIDPYETPGKFIPSHNLIFIRLKEGARG